MTNIRLMLTIFFMAFVLGVTCAKADDIGISTGPVGMTYNQQGNEIKNACTTLPINVFTSNGGVSNIVNLFTSNQMQFGIVAYDGLWFKQLTEPTKMNKIKVVMPLNMNTIHLIAGYNSGINSIGDLHGKRVNIGPPGSGSYISASIIRLKTNTKWRESTLSNKDALSKLRSGELDAVFYFSAMPVKELVELGKDVDGVIKLVNMKHPSLDGFYTLAEVPDNMYAWQTKSVFQYSVKNLLVTYDYKTQGKIDAVASLTTCIINALPNLQESGHPGWREVEPKSYTEVKWPMHPAARQVIDGHN